MRRKGSDAQGEALVRGYADLQEIGGGAFATVYRAIEVDTGRAVALKILKVDAVHSQLIATFHREIHALAAVSDHPHIVTLYRPSTTSDGRPVLVLELCRESLAQQLRSAGPLASPEVTDIGIKIAGALETAHRNGFLHRDMKPQNILITQFGQPALADFGVAALQASAQMTAGVLGLTTLHAAPEMLEGQHLSPATDVYGLASTMYQLLTGRAPFTTYEHEAPASVILRILRDPVRPIRSEKIPLALADLLESGMAKKPEGRPRSAAEFAGVLRDVQAEQGWPESAFVAWGEEGPGAAPIAAEPGPRGVRVVPPLLPASGAAPGVGETDAPPTLQPRRPSVAEPGPAHRNVVQPVEAIGGRGGPPPTPVSRPEAPIHPPPARASAAPLFVDPEPVAPETAPPSEIAGFRSPPRAGPGATTTVDHDRSGPVYAAWSIAAVAVAVLVIIAAALVVAGVI